MPNPIKYNTSTESNALKSGNFWIGTGDVSKGPTSQTGYWNGITPPAGGYCVYINKASQGPSIHVAANSSELISITNMIAGTSYTTEAQCLAYYAGETDKMCVNRDYEGIVTDGLVLNLDAGFTPSYPRSGTTWYDVSGNSNNGTLINGPTFDSGNGGSIVFDGSNDFILVSDIPFRFTNTFTLDGWVYFDGNDINGTIIGKRNGSPFNQYSIAIYSGNPYVGGVGKVATFFGRAEPTSDITLTYTLPSAGFYNIVASINTTSQILYINGITQSSASVNISSNTFNISGRDLLIGATRNNDGTGIIGPFIGNIPQTKIYAKALTASEVLQNYNAQKDRFGL